MPAQLSSFLTGVSALSVHRVVLFDASLVLAEEDVLVGCGTHHREGIPPSGALILNNKGTETRFGRTYDSVTRLLDDPPPSLLDPWPLWAKRPVAPADALGHIRLVVEDASPDSLFGVLLLLGRLAGLLPRQFPPGWIEAVDDWEVTGNTDEPATSWCALASALGHSHIPIGIAATPALLAAAWTDGLRFAAACLASDAGPESVGKRPNLPEWRRAAAALQQERRVYLDWLPHAAIVQLSLPLAGTQDRRLLVDGLLFIEDQVTGTAKAFYRSDITNAPLGEGFTLAAHYRPSEAGTGNDFTLSVDPRRGVHLRELWEELERREDAAWKAAGAERPCDRPRPLSGVPARANEPWFITPNLTLIGAPRRLPNGTPGSRLGWADVRDAVWTVFNPVRDVTVWCTPRGPSVPLLELRPEPLKPVPGAAPLIPRKVLLVALWPRSRAETTGAAPRALSAAPIMARVLAALVARGSRPAPLTLDRLPPDQSWKKVSLSGGFAIVSHDGVLVLDDWRDRDLDLARIKDAFSAAVVLDATLYRLEQDEFRPLVNDLRETLGREDRWRETEPLLRRVVQLGNHLSGLRAAHATPPEESDARAVYDAASRRWALDRRLTAIETEVKAVETSLRSLSELRIVRVTRAIAIYGFPLGLAGTLSTPVARVLDNFLRGSDADKNASGLAILGCYVVIAILGWGIVKLALRRERRLNLRG